MESWNTQMSSGLDAIIQAYKVYVMPNENHEEIINQLIKYNQIDVRIIEKIINYLEEIIVLV